MVLVAVPVLLLAGQYPFANGDPRYIQYAAYIAGSKVMDPEAPGGFGPSDRYPAVVKDLKLLGNAGPKATLVRTKKGFVLHLANAGPKEVWFRAGDSNLLGYLEAKDSRGVWRPIEYKPWYTCGNSYHRVQLPAGMGWSFEREVPTGDLKTSVRWRFTGPDELISNEVASTIPSTRFELEPKSKSEWKLHEGWGYPVLVPNSFQPPVDNLAAY